MLLDNISACDVNLGDMKLKLLEFAHQAVYTVYTNGGSELLYIIEQRTADVLLMLICSVLFLFVRVVRAKVAEIVVSPTIMQTNTYC